MNWRRIPGVRSALTLLELIMGGFAYNWNRLVPSLDIIVLAYHSVSDSSWIHAVKPEEFVQQIQWLKKNADVLTIDSALQAAYGERSRTHRPRVILTFDDAYQDWQKAVLPILEHYQVPATFFVTTSLSSVTSVPHKHLVIATADDIVELSKSPYITIGSHTVSHADLATCSEEQFVQELRESKATLEKLIHKPVRHLSYPKGRYRDSRFPLIEELGYVCAFAGHGTLRSSTPPYAIPRLPVTKMLSLALFKARLYRYLVFQK